MGSIEKKRNLVCAADVVKRSKAAGLKSVLHIYSGVTHAYAKRTRNPNWFYDSEAAEDTKERTKAFLAQHLR